MAEDSPPSAIKGSEEGSSNQWAELKELFHSALSLDPPERQVFIEKECGSNEELRRELESLLLAYEETGNFLEQPAAPFPFSGDSLFSSAGTVAPFAEQEKTSAVGKRIGAYLLEQEIGHGGMGTVYLATRADGEFTKRVAIKLIRDGRETDFAVRRFRQERQILARLENPYIARLIDGGSTENGSPYFVMEYVEGKPITEFCEERTLNTREQLELFIKICSAVQYAHDRNIIHRDLKPGNILIKNEGTPKLLDFGIAKILGADAAQGGEATVAGFRLLTPTYASPEQMRGEGATERSDVYSLGVVLYELLCGERPSLSASRQSGTADTGTAHLSASLQAIVLRAIQWNPNERYSSAKTLAADLQRYLAGERQGDSPEARRLDNAPAQISIAILPFRFLESKNDDNAFPAFGITDALVFRLSRVERLSVRPTSSTLKYANEPNTAKAAQELKVTYVLAGSWQVVDQCVRVSVELIHSETGVAIWTAQFYESAQSLVKLEDSLAEQVASALVPHLTGEEREQVVNSGTASGKAYELYLRGRWHWSRNLADQEELAKSLLCFQQAIAEDPNYARAYAGMADCYFRLGLWGGSPPAGSFTAALEAAEQAVRMDPSLGEAHASLGAALWACKRDHVGAEQHFNLAIIRNPNYANAHYWFGLLNAVRQRPELAIANLERAHRIDPHSPVIVAGLGLVYYNARRFERAIQFLAEAARELPGNNPVIDSVVAWCYLQAKEPEKALAAARRAYETDGGSSAAISALASAERACGHVTAAQKLRNQLEEMFRHRYVSWYDRAAAALATDDVPGALRCLEQADTDRDWWASWIGVDPRWDAIRAQPAFTKLALKVQQARTVDVASSEQPKNSSARRRLRIFLAAGALALLAIAMLVRFRLPVRPAPFQDLKFTRLTSNGIADEAVISPSGQYIAYTAKEGGDTSLFLRDLASSRTVKLLPRIRGTVEGLNFTENGRKISFVNFPREEPMRRRLFTLPLNGGTPHQVPGTFGGPVALSPDGNHTASLESNVAQGQDELWAADVLTGKRQLLAALRYPARFSWSCTPAWSPDGKQVTFATEEQDKKGFFIKLHVVSAVDSTRFPVPSPRWQWVERVAWAAKDPALVVIGQQQDSSFQQIWYVPYGGGESRAIVNDLDDYAGVTIGADDSEIISVQKQTLSNIYVTDSPAKPSHTRQVTQGNGRYFDLSWMPDGKILYASDATGSADLWVMNPDGTGQRQITSEMGRSYGPVSSPDGRVIAFHSNRTSNWQIWRVNADGSHPKQLSVGLHDGNWPQFTPDGRSILFHQSEPQALFTLWKVPVEGGTPVQITRRCTMHPAISAKTGQIAAWFSATVENPQWKLAVFSPEGGDPVRIFDPTPAARPDTSLRWTPKGDGITFLDYANGATNLWVQPLDGSPPKRLTSFPAGDIYSFDWSRNGELVYSQGLTTADVVLIRDAQSANRSETRAQQH